MNDQQHHTGPDQPRAERELSDYQHQAEQLACENKMLRAVLDSMPANIAIKDLTRNMVELRVTLAVEIGR
jgi:hypothetical protein